MALGIMRDTHGRPLCTDTEAARRGFQSSASALRRRVLVETLRALDSAEKRAAFRRLAERILAGWAAKGEVADDHTTVRVFAGDWGDVTAHVTATLGHCFAVLNMANAIVPGGAYVEGAAAQEENMFRRTDCHFAIDESQYDRSRDCYRSHMTDLISGCHGRVYLDAVSPRICLRGAESPAADGLGYRWLTPTEVFPFLELRAAATDLRGGLPYDPAEMRKRIRAQFDTLSEARIRHVVLGAFGCGAFCNPATLVAGAYAEEIATRLGDFDCIAFAIRSAGYGPDNYEPFAVAISNMTM